MITPLSQQFVWEQYKSIDEWLFAVFGVIVILEIAILIFRKKATWQQFFINCAIYAAQFVIRALILIPLFSYLRVNNLVEKMRLFEIPTSLLSLILCFIFVDLIFYWKHRMEHRVALFWVEHRVHHSSTEYNLSMSYRTTWFFPLFYWIIYAPAVLIGFDPLVVFICRNLIFILMVPLHTELLPRVKWLEYVFNSPSLHRVHHGKDQRSIDKNFGGVFIFWDHLFGTFAPEIEPVQYGVEGASPSWNPLKVYFDGHRELYHKVRVAEGGLKGKISTLLQPP